MLTTSVRYPRQHLCFCFNMMPNLHNTYQIHVCKVYCSNCSIPRTVRWHLYLGHQVTRTLFTNRMLVKNFSKSNCQCLRCVCCALRQNGKKLVTVLNIYNVYWPQLSSTKYLTKTEQKNLKHKPSTNHSSVIRLWLELCKYEELFLNSVLRNNNYKSNFPNTG